MPAGTAGRRLPVRAGLLRGLWWLLLLGVWAGTVAAQSPDAAGDPVRDPGRETARETAPEPAPALLVDSRASINVWPSLTMVAETNGPYRAEDLLAQPQRFVAPASVPSNLGRQFDAVWLRVPLVVPSQGALPSKGAAAVQRVLEIDYPPLNQVDVSLWRDGQRVAHHRLGNHLALADRPLATRTHAAALDLQPGRYVLLMRVQSLSSLVLPITLRTPADFTRYESQVQLMQGALLGVALCMLLYSLAHWISLRDPVFLDYAMLLAGNTVFALSYFGIGALWLWPNWPELGMRVAPMGVMVAVVAGTRFTRATLEVHEISPALDMALRVIGAAALCSLFGFGTGLIGYRAAQVIVTALGIAVTVAVLPISALRARRGDAVARYMLMGWAAYAAGAIATAALLRGLIEPTFWTQHVYPLSTLVEMAAWMAVLGQRVKSIHGNADRARVESETLRTMAHTDALTGLPNRRGLYHHLGLALQSATPERMLAVYMLDLDGFKPVNDRHGHDVGDALLVAVGQRLKDALRGPDVVARMGGDEFVVLAAGFKDEAAAQTLGAKLLATFNQPFAANGQRCEVGLTIGYALAPVDGTTAETVLKLADAAMYAGKQQGRNCVLRASREASGAAPAAAPAHSTAGAPSAV